MDYINKKIHYYLINLLFIIIFIYLFNINVFLLKFLKNLPVNFFITNFY